MIQTTLGSGTVLIKPRRAGDIAMCYADPTKAKEELGWEAKKDLETMCKDSWRYAQNLTK